MAHKVHHSRIIGLAVGLLLGSSCLAIIPPATDIQGNRSITQLEQRLSKIDDELKTLATFSLRGATGTIGCRSKPREANHFKWLKIRLDETASIDEVVLVPVIRRTEHNGLQADGFPLAFRVILGAPHNPEGTVVAEYDETHALLPRIAPLTISCKGIEADWIRIEVDRLSISDQNDRFVFRLSEIMVFSGDENVALHQRVSAKSNHSDGLVWDKDFLVDGFVPYLMDAAGGEKSRPFVGRISNQVKPVLTIDLGSPLPLSRLHLHTIEKDDFIPQPFTSDFGVPRRIHILGANRPDFDDARTLLELDLSNPYNTSPIIMWRFPETVCRYVKLDLTDLQVNPFNKQTLRFGFSEIELFSRGKNVAFARPIQVNALISPDDLLRPLANLTDGRNIYGSILPIRDWMGQLARRHDLESERPLLQKELNRLYDRQRITLRRLGWLSALLTAGIAFTILINRLLRMREVQAIKHRLAADLHDELGANVHTIGLLSDAAKSASNAPEEWNMLHERIRALTNRTGIAIRHVGNMLEAKELYIGLVEDMRRAAQRITANIEHTFEVEGEPHLDLLAPQRRVDLFLFYKESLINICRHSNATRFSTRLTASPREVILSVTDNGKGLSSQPIPSSLKRRARLLKAKLTITDIPNDGTGITLKLRPRKGFALRRMSGVECRGQRTGGTDES